MYTQIQVKHRQTYNYATVDKDFANSYGADSYKWWMRSDTYPVRTDEGDKRLLLHREVIEHYTPPPENGYLGEFAGPSGLWVCDHIDNNVYNATRNNLWWVPSWVNSFKRVNHKGYFKSGNWFIADLAAFGHRTRVTSKCETRIKQRVMEFRKDVWDTIIPVLMEVNPHLDHQPVPVR